MRHYREYSEEDIKRVAIEVSSLSQLLKKLGLRASGGNYGNMKKLLCQYKVDCDHWTGQGWNKGKRLKDWSQYARVANCKKHLISERGHECQHCNLKLWLNVAIPLEIHHIDGDRTNNDSENLLLLCPNCHSMTINFRGRKNLSAQSESSGVECFKFGESLTANAEPNLETGRCRDLTEQT